MDTINQILSQLGANFTFVYQFLVLTVFFAVMKYFVFDKLQFVLENRIEKSSNLETSADEKFEQINELAQKYTVEIESAYVEAQKNLNKEKTVFTIEKDKVFKSKEVEMESFINENREVIIKEIAAKKTEILKDTGALADDFVNKISK
jgi:F0F1-type ATP synthase membrane subunit b/b'